MLILDPRQKAERIVQLFRSRQPTEVLPAEVSPAGLDEAYAIRRAFQAIEEATGRGAIAGYKIGLTTPVMQKLCGVDEPCYGAIFAREVHHRRAELAAGGYCRIGPKARSPSSSAMTCRMGVIAVVSRRRSRAQWQPSS